ncbi:MAG: inositol monophosphatase family protein [Pseudomonadota bacterium]
MNTESPPLDDLDVLQDLVRLAGHRELLPRFKQIGFSIKADGSVVTEADFAVDDFLRTELYKRWPNINFLSEEMSESEQQAMLDDDSKSFWCIDPLDGTSNFVAGVPVFSICISLITAGQPVFGLIYDPNQDECFYATRGHGAWLNGMRLKPRELEFGMERAIALVDFKRLPGPLREKLVANPPYASQRNVGSCALEWAWMAARRGHLYLHGGQKLWDMAAGVLILEEAGGYSETLLGEPTFKSSLIPRSVIASPYESLFSTWRDWLRDNNACDPQINSFAR